MKSLLTHMVVILAMIAVIQLLGLGSASVYIGYGDGLVLLFVGYGFIFTILPSSLYAILIVTITQHYRTHRQLPVILMSWSTFLTILIYILSRFMTLNIAYLSIADVYLLGASVIVGWISTYAAVFLIRKALPQPEGGSE